MVKDEKEKWALRAGLFLFLGPLYLHFFVFFVEWSKDKRNKRFAPARSAQIPISFSYLSLGRDGVDAVRRSAQERKERNSRNLERMR